MHFCRLSLHGQPALQRIPWIIDCYCKRLVLFASLMSRYILKQSCHFTTSNAPFASNFRRYRYQEDIEWQFPPFCQRTHPTLITRADWACTSRPTLGMQKRYGTASLGWKRCNERSPYYCSDAFCSCCTTRFMACQVCMSFTEVNF